MIKTIKIGNRDVKLNANAATPIFYRSKFNRDLMQDLSPGFTVDGAVEYETYARLAYIMAQDAGEEVPEEYTDWLKEFDGLFDLIEALDDIMDVWNRSQKATVVPKKKVDQQNEK